ncbi:MAG: AAA family ATPase, partial [Selenomonadaceae bacterium]|nr:AAA family ATPase [Selenomonadaceae bacterium]
MHYTALLCDILLSGGEDMERKNYREKLQELSHSTGIKVLTGLRRSGKSALLAMFAEDLHSEGVPPEHIIAIDFDEL